MSRRLTLLVLPLVLMTACALNNRPTLSPTKMAEFWQEPTDAAQRDLLNGPGGAALAPNPKGTFNLLKADPTGFSPGLDVKDDKGQEWSIKLGPEARTEVVASRIVWAMGYHQPSVYYLPHFALRENGAVKTEGPGRFRLKPSTQKNLGVWSWRKNPFLDTQPFAGLFVLMTILNNWDIKTTQNGVYSTLADGGGPQYQYVVKDLGASFGKTNWWLPGTRDDIEGFEQEPFIAAVTGNRVKFHFRGAWQEPQLIDSVAPNDLRWMCERLARLTSAQWLDAFRAGGYTDAEAARFIRRIQQKIDEGLRITSSSAPRVAVRDKP
jgi:hypothetical protein